MKVTLIIVNFNGCADTLECLDSIKKAHLTKEIQLDIVVVDNASADDSVEKIRKQFPSVHIIIKNENTGFAEGNNSGITYALKRDADYVLLLNNDTYVAEDFITRLTDGAKKNSRGGIFVPKIYFAPGCETFEERYKSTELGKVIWYAGGLIDWENMLASHRGVDEVDIGQYDEVIKTAYATGCAMLIKKEVFDTVGFFDRRLYLYYEDLDFCRRAQKKGYDTFYIPQARMWHKNAKTAGGSGSDLQAYYITRNRLLVGMRYAPLRTKLALMREAMNLIMYGTWIQRQAVGDFIRKKYGKRKAPGGIPRINLLQFFGKKTKKPTKQK